jgi:hypothetical protein
MDNNQINQKVHESLRSQIGELVIKNISLQVQVEAMAEEIGKLKEEKVDEPK